MTVNQLIDTDFLKEIQELLEGEFPTLVNTYISDTEMRVEHLQKAIVAKDTTAVYEIAHSIKGSSLNLGVTVLSELCLRVEKAAREDDLSVAEELNSQIIEQSRATCEYLSKHFLE